MDGILSIVMNEYLNIINCVSCSPDEEVEKVAFTPLYVWI